MKKIICGRGLYGILDIDSLNTVNRGLEEGLEALIGSGAPVIQLRWKRGNAGEFLDAAKFMVRRCRSRGILSIINDRVDIAALSGADGVHLGQDDLPSDVVSLMMPEYSILGISTHNEAQVKKAIASGADYIGFGPVFPTSSKENPDPLVGIAGLKKAVETVEGRIPVVAIGGICLEHIRHIAQSGADYAAVISDILFDENPAQKAAGIHRAMIEGLDNLKSSC